MWSKLTVDMTTSTIQRDPLDKEWSELGGRALNAQVAMAKIPPTCDPLGKDNVLIISGGVFAGTNFTTAHRLSIGGKSPLTGGIKEANVGGVFGTLLAEHGIRLITIEGLPKEDELYLLYIKADGQVELLDGQKYRGLGNYAMVDAIHQEYGDKTALLSIGMAGERKYKAASIQSTEFGPGHPSRAAARGGIGALMGSKGLKGILIEKPTEKYQVEYADKEMFRAAALAFNQLIAEGAKTHPFSNIGTISTIEVTGVNGALPEGNFSGKFFPDYKKLGVEAFLSKLAAGGGGNKKACQPGCIVKCSNIYNDADGNYITSGFEYETIALFGPNCRITDYDAIALMDRMCDDIGVDTIDMGCAIGVAMDAGKIPWGDAQAAIGLLKEMEEGTAFGEILGNGCESVGLHLGCKRIPVVKHQAIAAYDPRNTKGTGITYATSPQGADHTAGITMGRAFEDTGRTAQAFVSNKLQVAMCFADSMMCIFCFAHIVPILPRMAEMIAGLYGGEVDFTRVTIGLGVRTLLTERAFNQAAGFTAEDDKLPEFFYTEMSAATGSVFDIGEVEMETLFNF